MKVALVHDWLFHMRGGEKVLEAFAELYPEATIYTLFYDRKNLSPSLKNMKIKSTFMQYLPGIKRYYRWLLPLLPMMIKSLRLNGEDLVLSSSHCVAKGINVPKGALHICYCHTPARYLWGFEDVYFSNYPFFIRPLIKGLLALLRKWDVKVNKDVDEFIANSENVKKRIKQYYRRNAAVIHPPVNLEEFKPFGELADYYLTVSAFVPYKRVDLVIDAFNEMDLQLIVVGAGPLANAYKNRRQSGKISFLTGVSGEKLRELYAQAKAVIFPTNEDFGIVPLEAQACGTPVIAFGQGGALESVKTGIFFEEQTPQSIRDAVLKFESQITDRSKIPEGVKSFDKDHFKTKVSGFIDQVLTRKKSSSHVAEA